MSSTRRGPPARPSRIHGTLLALLLIPAAAGAARGQEWAGRWEGFVETTNQSVMTQLDLARSGSAWDGTARIAGNPLTLMNLQIEVDSIRFELQLGPQNVAFGGRLAGERMIGAAAASGREFPFELRRLPSFAKPRSRLEGWEQDLEHVRTRFLEYDRSYPAEARAAARRELAALKASLPGLSESEILMKLSRVAALSGNAHTRLYLLRNRTALRRYPIRVAWFSDGLFVVRATAAHRESLGCQIVALGGRDPREARAAVAELFAANDSWLDYKSAYFLTSPEVLGGLGLVRDPEHLRLELACPDDARREHALEPLPLVRRSGPTENWRSLSPVYKGESELLPAGERWVHALTEGRVDVPLYLRNPNSHYWFDYLADRRILFFQYNRSLDMPEGESFAAFSERLAAALDSLDVAALVVDLRFNTGGNSGIARAFIDDLRTHPKLAVPHRLFVLTDQATFSAGLYHAAQFRESGGATLVGRHPGDRLEYWSEGGNILLPNSGLTIHFANGFHTYSKKPLPEGVRAFRRLSVDSLEPDLPVEGSSRDYFSGRDPLLEAVLAAAAR